MWGELVLYVGKTRQLLKHRALDHRTRNNIAHSKHIPGYMDWDIKLLEECPDGQGAIREQYWYDTLAPFYNYQRPGQTHAEYDKKYYEAHREEYSARGKQRYAAKKIASKKNAPFVQPS